MTGGWNFSTLSGPSLRFYWTTQTVLSFSKSPSNSTEWSFCLLFNTTSHTLLPTFDTYVWECPGNFFTAHKSMNLIKAHWSKVPRIDISTLSGYLSFHWMLSYQTWKHTKTSEQKSLFAGHLLVWVVHTRDVTVVIKRNAVYDSPYKMCHIPCTFAVFRANFHIMLLTPSSIILHVILWRYVVDSVADFLKGHQFVARLLPITM